MDTGLTRTGTRRRDAPSGRTSSLSILAIFVLFNLWYYSSHFSHDQSSGNVHVPLHAAQTLRECRKLHLKPGVPDNFYERETSDRFQPGTKPVLIRNATIWTGRVQGLEVITGDLLLEGGLIKQIGHISPEVIPRYKDLEVIDVNGAWVTPGVIDVHSHLGVGASPALSGASDGNSLKGLTLPWLRSLDGINTHDDGYASSIAGGLTTALILPGSADAIGGQAFVMKLRPTAERSPTSMLLEPPFNLNYSYDGELPLRWRHIKHACGENPSRVYSGTRMDTFWAFRQAYDTARKIKNSQDEYCAKAVAGDWRAIEGKDFPESLQWEALVDVLRGRVKVQTHCYEAVDIDDFVRLTNEFQFPVAAFHHAHEAWLVPDVLKRAYEHPPAIAMFAAFARYKREAYRHSEFAPRVLASHDIDVVMKSDHSAIVSRYLIHEAAQAHYWGLEKNVALASVTTTAAKVLGLDHRIGFIKSGYDADIVVWDSHPLALGATPIQVFIDGLRQIQAPYTVPKPAAAQHAPSPPNFDKEADEAVKYEGLPPLLPPKFSPGFVVFANVSSVFSKNSDGAIIETLSTPEQSMARGVVVVHDGRIVCQQLSFDSCASYIATDKPVIIDLDGGSIQPGLVTAGSQIGLGSIAMEPSTVDGDVFDPIVGVPSIVGGDGYVPRAADGLHFGTRDALLAYRAGVVTAITAPAHAAFAGGLSVAFSLGASSKLEEGAIVQAIVALHVTLGHGSRPSLSTEIATLRRFILHPPGGKAEHWIHKLAKGDIPLVVRTDNADIIATLLRLKVELEAEIGHSLRFTILGGAEAYLLAGELAKADVGVILMPPRPYPYVWDQRRGIAGLPITNESTIGHLLRAGVTVAIGPQGTSAEPALSGWAVRNLRWDAGWALLDSPHVLTRGSALAIASSNLERLLGLPVDPYESDLVATSGGDLLSFEGKVIAIISPRRRKVDFLESIERNGLKWA
ncbi:composite domain of metallo-dependent hydrolase [Trametopsis cervina]|nr:composite domain of metallo-dependent hydrolase [Trametopsis cervina]